MRDLKNKLTSSKNTKNIQNRRGKSFGYQVLGFGAGGSAGPPYEVDFLLLAGGGCGGNSASGSSTARGGGGAGGYRTTFGTSSGSGPSGGGASAESKILFQPGETITVTVGSGGSGASWPSFVGVGQNSSVEGNVQLSAVSSVGGGAGANLFQSSPAQPPVDGGSGGGGFTGGNAGGSGTANQGFDGGSVPYSNPNGYNCGGGGGAGAAGSDSSPSAGGTGVASSITASAVTRGGGGGGGAFARFTPGPTSGGSGGSGGGGNGSNGASPGTTTPNETPGSANTGGGGGGANGMAASTGASGGSGVVIIRLPTASYSGATTGSPTVTTSGTDTILTFTGTGTITG
jgi:hypothetical protein